MIELPPLSDAALVRVSRQGGLAYLAGRAASRDIDLRNCTEAVRRDVCQALRQAAPVASDDAAPGGDQRYFRIEIRFLDERAAVSFHVPEAQAPELLQRVWKSLL